MLATSVRAADRKYALYPKDSQSCVFMAMNDLAWSDDLASEDETNAEQAYNERCKMNHAEFIVASRSGEDLDGIAIRFTSNPEDGKELGVTYGWGFWLDEYRRLRRKQQDMDVSDSRDKDQPVATDMDVDMEPPLDATSGGTESAEHTAGVGESGADQDGNQSDVLKSVVTALREGNASSQFIERAVPAFGRIAPGLLPTESETDLTVVFKELCDMGGISREEGRWDPKLKAVVSMERPPVPGGLALVHIHTAALAPLVTKLEPLSCAELQLHPRAIVRHEPNNAGVSHYVMFTQRDHYRKAPKNPDGNRCALHCALLGIGVTDAIGLPPPDKPQCPQRGLDRLVKLDDLTGRKESVGRQRLKEQLEGASGEGQCSYLICDVSRDEETPVTPLPMSSMPLLCLDAKTLGNKKEDRFAYHKLPLQIECEDLRSALHSEATLRLLQTAREDTEDTELPQPLQSFCSLLTTTKKFWDASTHRALLGSSASVNNHYRFLSVELERSSIEYCGGLLLRALTCQHPIQGQILIVHILACATIPQRQGYGRFAVRAVQHLAVREGQRMNCRWAVVCANAIDDAKEFYEKQGFIGHESPLNSFSFLMSQADMKHKLLRNKSLSFNEVSNKMEWCQFLPNELHTRGFILYKNAIPLAEDTVKSIKEAKYDENGLPIGPESGRDTNRQQTCDRSGTSGWIKIVKDKQTEFLRTRGHLKCSQGEKEIKKMHGLKSLRTPGYDDKRDALVPQQGDQKPHTDEELGFLNRYLAGKSDEDVPLSTILAIEEGSCLRIRPKDKEGAWTIVNLDPGDLLIFRGDVCHNGLGYARENVRVHAYVYPPDYNPGASSINSCDE